MKYRDYSKYRKQTKTGGVKKMFKYAMVFMLGVATALLIVVTNTYYHKTPLERTISDMSRTCEASSQMFDSNLDAACKDLIDRVQSRGYEVLSKDGKFWAEYNPEASK